MKAQQEFTKDAIADIAKFQSLICWVILVTVLAYIFMPILTIGTTIASLCFVYPLANSLREVRPWVYAMAMFIPLVSLVVLVMLIKKSTKVLRANNIKVGLMGANKTDLDKFLNSPSRVNKQENLKFQSYNIIGYVLLVIAGLLLSSALYFYRTERIMPDPEEFGLVFTIFCLPPGFIFLLVGLCLIPNKAVFLKLFGVGFLLFSVSYYSEVYLSTQLPARNDVLYLSTEFISPLLGLILLGLGFKFEKKH